MSRLALDTLPWREAPLALLGIERADIEANRRGGLGRLQRRKRRRGALIGLGVCVAIGVLLFAGGAMSQANGGQWFVPDLLGVVVIGFGVGVATPRLRRRDPAVRCLTGQVRIMSTRSSAMYGGTFLVLIVGEERCFLPQTLRSTYKNWRAILSPDPYNVYVIDGPPGMVVGVEPA